MTNVVPAGKTDRKKRVLVVDDDRGLNRVLVEMLRKHDIDADGVPDGESAVRRVSSEKFNLVLLDVGLPKMNGFDVLKKIRALKSAPRVIVMTSDDTPTTVLNAVKEQAYRYVSKPSPPKMIIEIAKDVLAAKREALPIEIVSSKPDWIELLVPCQLESADRIQSFLAPFESSLAKNVKESVGQAFRELLMNAIEWGGGLDPKRKVRIACIRARRMLLYRIQDPGPGFRPDNLPHAAISNDPDNPFAHAEVRAEKNLRPGGFGLLMTKALVDELVYNEAHNEVVFVKYL
jgi:DNA-binding response OmpR family regulator/anti-sigma regulatory factor (Ser/Thr protein kinase)